jgi:hypothetical protein
MKGSGFRGKIVYHLVDYTSQIYLSLLLDLHFLIRQLYSPVRPKRPLGSLNHKDECIQEQLPENVKFLLTRNE